MNTDKYKNKSKQETLRDIPLFSELSIQDLRKITAISELKFFQKNSFLFMENDKYLGFYILLKGAIKVFKILDDGREVVVHIIRPIDSFAELPLFEKSNYPVNATAIEESLTLFIPKEAFLELLKENNEISLKMLAGFAKRMMMLVNKIESLTAKEVRIRLAAYLLNEIELNGTIDLPEPFVKLNISKKDLAAYLGTITETLSRTLAKLQNEGIIRLNKKKIFITDKKKLRGLTKH